MKKYRFLILLLSPLLMFCHKHESNPQPEAPSGLLKDYIKMKLGNYWIYEQYNVNTMQGTKSLQGIDSVYVIADTVINEITYSRIATKSFSYVNPYEYYGMIFRDSLDYLKDWKGETLFSAYNFKDTLMWRDRTEYISSYKMEHKDSILTLSSGTYTTYDFKGTIIPKPQYLNNYNSVLYSHAFYAKDIGIVKTISWYIYGDGYIENNLVRYHVQ